MAATTSIALDEASRAIAEGLVHRAATAERRRQWLWWFTLAAQFSYAAWAVTLDEPYLTGLWGLGFVFVANMIVHFALGAARRARLAIDADREAFDVGALVDAVAMVRRGLTANVAVRTVDARRPVRAR